MTLDAALARDLHGRALRAQVQWRTPALSAGIVRDGELVWTAHVGSARLGDPGPDGGSPAGDDTQFMIGSITKTFTALLVMALRDDGALRLDDTLGRWFPQSRHAGLPLRQLLAHASGLQREPVGRIWESLQAPDAQAFVTGLEWAEQVLPGHTYFHYSNLAYGLLGQIVEHVEGASWEAVCRRRILDPLGMTHTSVTPEPTRAIGYEVDPFTGVATEEPLFDLRAAVALGGLWSTVADLARYGAFVADPAAYPGVVAPETLDEMCMPLVMADPDGWVGGYGLGFGMARIGDRVHVGHGGAMPGYLSGLRVRRRDKVAAIVLTNGTARATPTVLAGQLLDAVLDADPVVPAAWRPETPDPVLAEIAGPWWSEGDELVFYVDGGALWSRLAGDEPLDRTRYRPDGPDRFRADQGRERGEVLELVRDESGALVKMYFATYAVTRTPKAFAEMAAAE